VVLHAARFLGGPTCSLQHQWLLAREIHDLDGVTPLSGYDTDALGISGCVTSHGWLEIHNPANPHLKLKYFSSSNVGSTALSSCRFFLADGENSVDINESFKELMHMEDLRSAVHTLMKAMSLALPWNYSVSALESFLFGSSYCADKTSHWPNRAKELSDFVDHVLHSKARRWTTRQPFLDATTLRPVFETWVASRPAGRLVATDTEKEDQPKTESNSWKRHGNRGGKSSNNNSGSSWQSNSGSSSHGSGGGGGGSGGGLSTARDWSGTFKDLCRRYNSHSGCPEFRANSMMAVQQKEKVRIIMNLSSPSGLCFNDAVDTDSLEKVHMSTAKSFGFAILEYGRHARLWKLDMSDAYKNLPARPEDLRLQWFSWLQAFFVETQQAFGACTAVAAFDRLGNTIMTPAICATGIPRHLVFRTLGDGPVVTPAVSPDGPRFCTEY
jgi:hypothetical protein